MNELASMERLAFISLKWTTGWIKRNEAGHPSWKFMTSTFLFCNPLVMRTFSLLYHSWLVTEVYTTTSTYWIQEGFTNGSRTCPHRWEQKPACTSSPNILCWLLVLTWKPTNCCRKKRYSWMFWDQFYLSTLMNSTDLRGLTSWDHHCKWENLPLCAFKSQSLLRSSNWIAIIIPKRPVRKHSRTWTQQKHVCTWWSTQTENSFVVGTAQKGEADD